jgi:dephospho-CoA kinase
MLRVGLTGGIGCGKSTVAAIMRELGCYIVEADKLAHRAIEPECPAYVDVVKEFGRGILMSDGRIDRAKLGEIVFADAARLARLNAIVHPVVIEAQVRELSAIGESHPHAIAVVEAALLIEARIHEELDYLVVASCTPEQQLERLTHGTSETAGRGLPVEQARQRIAAQMPLEEKRSLADAVIDCSGSLSHTREQVSALVAKLHHIETQRPAGHHSPRRIGGGQAGGGRT